MPEPATAAVTPPESATPAPRSWLEALRVYLEPSSLRMLTLGFSAGLPLLLVLGTLSFRLREAGIDRSTIGYLSWVGLAYGFKWVWAPLVDRLPIPGLTRAAGPPAQLAAAVAGGHHRGPGGHGAGGPAPDARADRLVRAGGGLRLGHAGHRAGRLPHRVGRPGPAGRAGRQLPDRLPPGHDLGRRGRVVDRGALGSGARRAGGRAAAGPGATKGLRPTRTAPGAPPTW